MADATLHITPLPCMGSRASTRLRCLGYSKRLGCGCSGLRLADVRSAAVCLQLQPDLIRRGRRRLAKTASSMRLLMTACLLSSSLTMVMAVFAAQSMIGHGRGTGCWRRWLSARRLSCCMEWSGRS